MKITINKNIWRLIVIGIAIVIVIVLLSMPYRTITYEQFKNETFDAYSLNDEKTFSINNQLDSCKVVYFRTANVVDIDYRPNAIYKYRITVVLQRNNVYRSYKLKCKHLTFDYGTYYSKYGLIGVNNYVQESKRTYEFHYV